jgi:hypothetical protein
VIKELSLTRGKDRLECNGHSQDLSARRLEWKDIQKESEKG